MKTKPITLKQAAEILADLGFHIVCGQNAEHGGMDDFVSYYESHYAKGLPGMFDALSAEYQRQHPALRFLATDLSIIFEEPGLYDALTYQQ